MYSFKKDEAARISKSIKYSDMQLSLLFFEKSVGRDEYFMEKSLSTCLHNSSYFHLGKVSFDTIGIEKLKLNTSR